MSKLPTEVLEKEFDKIFEEPMDFHRAYDLVKKLPEKIECKMGDRIFRCKRVVYYNGRNLPVLKVKYMIKMKDNHNLIKIFSFKSSWEGEFLELKEKLFDKYQVKAL